jgi:hypothetical protein
VGEARTGEARTGAGSEMEVVAGVNTNDGA